MLMKVSCDLVEVPRSSRSPEVGCGCVLYAFIHHFLRYPPRFQQRFDQLVAGAIRLRTSVRPLASVPVTSGLYMLTSLCLDLP